MKPQTDFSSKKRYRLDAVRMFCQEVYGNPLSRQTFTHWRRRMKVMQGVHSVGEHKAKLLIKYAELRREHGYYFKDEQGVSHDIDHELVNRELAKNSSDADWLRSTLDRLAQYQALAQQDWVFSPTLGRDLPKLIKRHKGEVCSEWKIRRIFQGWNRTFHRNKFYDGETISYLMNWLDRPKQRKVKKFVEDVQQVA